jgi:hypothetical protein
MALFLEHHQAHNRVEVEQTIKVGQCPKCGALMQEGCGTKDGVTPNSVFARLGFVADLSAPGADES